MAGEQLCVTEAKERGKRLSLDSDLLIGRVAPDDGGRLGGPDEPRNRLGVITPRRRSRSGRVPARRCQPASAELDRDQRCADLDQRHRDAIGALFCVIDRPTRGRPWSATAARGERRRYAAAAGVRRRFAPHQLRHVHAVELAPERVPCQ
jgi:hypothetical protein